MRLPCRDNSWVQLSLPGGEGASSPANSLLSSLKTTAIRMYCSPSLPGLMPPDFASKPSAPGNLGMFTLPVVRTGTFIQSATPSLDSLTLHMDCVLNVSNDPSHPLNLQINPVFVPRHMSPSSPSGAPHTYFCQNPKIVTHHAYCKILPLPYPRIPPARCSRRWPPSCLGTPGACPEDVWIVVWTRLRPGSPVAASSRRWRWRCLPARAPIPTLLACPRCAMRLRV